MTYRFSVTGYRLPVTDNRREGRGATESTMYTPLASVLCAAEVSADYFPVSLFMASSMLKPDNLRAAA